MLIDSRLRGIVDSFSNRQVLIVGDVMLDEYVWGEVSRISPEAPVPVVNTVRRTYHPGGAGNVAANIAALNGVPLICSLIGDDPNGVQLLQALSGSGVKSVEDLIRIPGRPTTVKSRVVAHNQQMLRLDTEVQQPITTSSEDALLARVEQWIDRADVCVLSDYAKGVLTPRICQVIIGMANQRKRQVIVDPKGQDFTKYTGAFVITPNYNEAIQSARFLGNSIDTLDDAAQKLLSELRGTHLLVTMGANGMELYRQNQPRFYLPADARHVFDVTGAGDTVVATMALALATGATIENAMQIANMAAGIAVGKLGTATVTRQEILSKLSV